MIITKKQIENNKFYFIANFTEDVRVAYLVDDLKITLNFQTEFDVKYGDIDEIYGKFVEIKVIIYNSTPDKP